MSFTIAFLPVAIAGNMKCIKQGPMCGVQQTEVYNIVRMRIMQYGKAIPLETTV